MWYGPAMLLYASSNTIPFFNIYAAYYDVKAVGPFRQTNVLFLWTLFNICLGSFGPAKIGLIYLQINHEEAAPAQQHSPHKVYLVASIKG